MENHEKNLIKLATFYNKINFNLIIGWDMAIVI